MVPSYLDTWLLNCRWSAHVAFNPYKQRTLIDRSAVRHWSILWIGQPLLMGTLWLGVFHPVVHLVLQLGLFVGPFVAYHFGPWRRFRLRLTREDFCMYCGYSFQGHGKEGVCPECGKDIAVSLRMLEKYRHGTRFDRID